MPDVSHFESLFLEHLDWIERVSGILCSKNSMWDAEAEDFKSWIRLKLMEDDYAVLRRFRGDSKLTTYLATVITGQFHDYRRERHGRWRASAAAERLGRLAKDLEALVYRHGYSLGQAGEKLRTAGRTELSNTELARVLSQLPERTPPRPVEISAEPVLDAIEGSSNADAGLAGADREARHQGIMAALARVMSRLDAENAMIARMHFGDGRSIADVARALNLEQKPLYRRVEKLRLRLRAELEAEGVQDSDARGILPEEEGS